MRNISFIILTSLFLLINIPVVFSQSGNTGKKVERISPEQGFSNDLVYSIYQDSRGFIWFGTMFGLVRYDGVNYKTYRNDPLDSNTLSNDDIISISNLNRQIMYKEDDIGRLKVSQAKDFVLNLNNNMAHINEKLDFTSERQEWADEYYLYIRNSRDFIKSPYYQKTIDQLRQPLDRKNFGNKTKE